MTVRFFSIRHHGPGSASSLRQALEAWQPDALLVEGPPEADTVTEIAGRADLVPPVALLLYVPQQPHRAVYYPFAEFTPEWQALRYGLQQDIPVAWMDLAQGHRFALDDRPRDDPDPPAPRLEPIEQLARAAGKTSGDRWWETTVEQRRDNRDLFEAILEAMTALRAANPITESDRLREAAMRQKIRQTQAQYQPQRLAVVCGAWHAPALVKMPPQAEDAAQLHDLPHLEVTATWIPWSYGKLAARGGYRAGIDAPGWYHHLWDCRHRSPQEISSRWLSRVAALLRAEGFDTASAHVIEAVRLAETLAALRYCPMPGLAELHDAAQAVMSNGSQLPLAIVAEKLVIGDRLGSVPADLPATPLQQDWRHQSQKLRLKPQAEPQRLELDLRKPLDLGRSHFLHRLQLLGVPWGNPQPVVGLGTFREVWELTWYPQLDLALIEATSWGSTIVAAATAKVRQQAGDLTHLPGLSRLLDALLRADLADAAGAVGDRLQAVSSLTRNVAHLAAALAPLVRIWRYGNVRQTDAAWVRQVADNLLVRCCLGFPEACRHLNLKASREMFAAILAVHEAIALLDDDESRSRWQETLQRLLDSPQVGGYIGGGSGRLLLDGGAISPERVARHLGWVLSPATDPMAAAAWLDGFLQGSGLLLLHDDRLFGLLEAWVRSLDEDRFIAVLPLLRRTFAQFSAAERRQLGTKVRFWGVQAKQRLPEGENPQRAARVLPVLRQIFG